MYRLLFLIGIGEIPPPPPEDVSPWDSRESGVDAFTLMHYDLDVCTNSLQVSVISVLQETFFFFKWYS